MMKRILTIFAIFIMAPLACVQTASAQFHMMPPSQIGEPAPDVILESLNGDTQTLSEFRDGNRAIVFFWATWCPHCRRELKGLSDQSRVLEKKGIKLATIDLGENARLVKRYIEKNKINVEAFLDETQQSADQFGIIGLPTFFFIDEQGVVQNVSHSLPRDLDVVFGREK